MDQHGEIIHQFQLLQAGCSDQGFFLDDPRKVGELGAAFDHRSGNGNATAIGGRDVGWNTVQEMLEHCFQTVPFARAIAVLMKRLELPVSLAIDGEQGFGAAQIPCQKGECRHLQGRFAIDAQAAWRRRKSQAMPAALGKEIEW